MRRGGFFVLATLLQLCRISNGLKWVPALDNVASLGQIWNLPEMTMTSTSVLNKIPETSVRYHNFTYTTFKSTVIRSESDRLSAMDIQADVKISILSGLAKASGGFSMTQTNSGNVKRVNAMIFARTTTSEAELLWGDPGLSSFFVNTTLRDLTPSYVISRVRLGYEYIIKFEAQVAEGLEDSEVEGMLGAEVSKLKAVFNAEASGTTVVKTKVKNSDLNVTIDVTGHNITLPSPDELISYEALAKYITKLNAEITTFRSIHRGYPLSYGIVPINEVQKVLNISECPNTIRSLQEMDLLNSISIFDSLVAFQKKLLGLQNDFYEFRDCIAVGSFGDLNKLLIQQSESFFFLKDKIKEAIVSERRGVAGLLRWQLSEFNRSNRSIENLQLEFETNLGEYESAIATFKALRNFNVSCLHWKTEWKDFSLYFKGKLMVVLVYHSDELSHYRSKWHEAIIAMFSMCTKSFSRIHIHCHSIDCQYNGKLCGDDTYPRILVFDNGVEVYSGKNVSDYIMMRDTEERYRKRRIRLAEHELQRKLKLKLDLTSYPTEWEQNLMDEIDVEEPNDIVKLALINLELRVADLTGFINMQYKEMVHDEDKMRVYLMHRAFNIGELVEGFSCLRNCTSPALADSVVYKPYLVPFNPNRPWKVPGTFK